MKWALRVTNKTDIWYGEPFQDEDHTVCFFYVPKTMRSVFLSRAVAVAIARSVRRQGEQITVVRVPT